MKTLAEMIAGNDPAPGSRCVMFDDLAHDDCRWPLGNPRSSNERNDAMNIKSVEDVSVFEIGDIVRLTGGADKMTVVAPPDESDGDPRLSVIWHDADGALHEAAIHPAALVLVKRGADARLR